MIEWLRHKKITDNEERVEIKKLKIKEIIIVFGIFIGLSVGLYYLLESFGTDLLILNTIILSFSFLNTYFSYRRSIFQYFCYVVEEAIYITLWFASWIKGNGGADIFAICGIFSFAWGIYSFINWIKIYKKQINS
jgi:nicotinamide riboside transporter PnuC